MTTDTSITTSPVAMHFLPDATRTQRMNTEELRANFLVQGLFQPGAVTLRRIDLDRVVLGGAVPTTSPLALEVPSELLAYIFCVRRELGVLNIGDAGRVSVDGVEYALGNRDLVYVGCGSRA